jgi:prepilin-type N-terminal cleavage/methylation domain-containing protein
VNSRVSKHIRGFTLIEMVISMVIISIAAVALLNAMMNSGRALRLTDRVQVGANLVNECAEYIVSSRRNGTKTYAQINSTICDFLPLSGFTRTVTLAALATSACPTGAACQSVTVSAYEAGALASQGVFMITNY